MRRSGPILERGDTRALRAIAGELGEGETIELGLSGSFGALSSGAYGSGGFSLAEAIDPFDVFLTDQRLIATRRGLYRRGGPRAVLACDRAMAHISNLSRNPLFDRVTLVFRDQTLGLTTSRRDRAKLDRLVRALDHAGRGAVTP